MLKFSLWIMHSDGMFVVCDIRNGMIKYSSSNGDNRKLLIKYYGTVYNV